MHPRVENAVILSSCVGPKPRDHIHILGHERTIDKEHFYQSFLSSTLFTPTRRLGMRLGDIVEACG